MESVRALSSHSPVCLLHMLISYTFLRKIRKVILRCAWFEPVKFPFLKKLANNCQSKWVNIVKYIIWEKSNLILARVGTHFWLSEMKFLSHSENLLQIVKKIFLLASSTGQKLCFYRNLNEGKNSVTSQIKRILITVNKKRKCQNYF